MKVNLSQKMEQVPPQNVEAEAPILSLHPDHLADLQRSGLSDETIKELGIYSARPGDIARLVGWNLPGVQSACVFPYLGADNFCRLKVFPPFKDKEGHTVRYLQKPGSGVHLYIPPIANRVLINPTIPLSWTEGEKKAAKACQEGIACIGLGGLWNWLEDGKTIAGLDAIAHVEREEAIYPDSDTWVGKPDCLRAVYAFGKALEAKGARVTVAVVPPGLDGEKQGLDDYLVKMEREGMSPQNALAKLKRIPLKHRVFFEVAHWWKSWQSKKDKGFEKEETPTACAVPPTKDLIQKVVDLLNSHIFFKDKRVPLFIAIWILGTYLYEGFTFFGYLWINSPVKRCGKSLLGDILSCLCHNATSRLSNLGEASLFRLADKGQTLILDEIENLREQDRDKYGSIMSVLNHGYQAGGKVPRVERFKDAWGVVEYSAYCPKVIAGINRLVDTVEDRSFKVTLVRKTEKERVTRFNLRKQGRELQELRCELTLWKEARKEAITKVYDRIEEIEELSGLDDRFKDISEPLVAIAAFADAEVGNGKGEVLPVLLSLLKDLGKQRGAGDKQETIVPFVQVTEEILGQEERVFVSSKELLDRVKKEEELSWISSTKALATLLGRFDLISQRDPKGDKRGYWISRDWLEEVKSRYTSLIPGFETSEASER